jgi:pimeloyl-ACP methyl ester carboxylesterase
MSLTKPVSNHPRARRQLMAALLLSCACTASFAQASPRPQVGVVLMHGSGSSSAGMSYLADRLRQPGWSIANIDMPWSGTGQFSEPVDAAERKVLAELERLRSHGATRLVLVGYSKGGLFAAHIAGKVKVDALVAIAPNGGSDQKKLGDQLDKARALVAQGKGMERTLLKDGDVVGADIRYDLPGAVPSAYLTWFDPQGAMNFERIWRDLRPGTPTLLIVPTKDLANLVKIKQPLFDGLPPHPANKLYEPDTDHLGAVTSSEAEIVRWLSQVMQPQ